MSEEKICYKCSHFNKWDDRCWCIKEPYLTWNEAPNCLYYDPKRRRAEP
ncbi:MAG: hypothetical protein MUO31_00905 [Thermodesulfovibrionales bacterium]|nr:hypothetical protein [Thermodesulfovibrionales bacterium]